MVKSLKPTIVRKVTKSDYYEHEDIMDQDIERDVIEDINNIYTKKVVDKNYKENNLINDDNKFTTAEELYNNFIVFGSFYIINGYDGNSIPCRNLLEIYEKSYFRECANNSDIYGNKPDAIFVLMNPGSSSPLDDYYKEPVYSIEELRNSGLKNSLVLAKPDATQHQVMRLMEFKRWKHIRIINLSDIREGKSDEFINKFIWFEGQYRNRAHSIFCDERKSELAKALDCKTNTILVLGWGTKDKLKSLAKLSLEQLSDKQVIGLKHKKGDWRYYHPCPPLKSDKLKWIERMKGIL